MSSKSELDSTYMGTALLHAKLSKSRRDKVGAVLVTPQGVTLTGYNGTPPGMDNNCEDEVRFFDPVGSVYRVQLQTKPEVIHAELNCILKAAREGVSALGSTIYVTLSPCLPCAAMLASAGIKRVVYLENYRDSSGLQYLKAAKIEVEQMKEEREYADD